MSLDETKPIQIPDSFLDEKFQAAVNLINLLPEYGPIPVSISEKLRFYSLFKIATNSFNIDTQKPSIFEPIKRLKYGSIKTLLNSGMTQDHAKKQYIHEIGVHLKRIYESGKTNEYLDNSDLTFLQKLKPSDMQALLSEMLSVEDANSDMIKTFFKIKENSFDRGSQVLL